MIMKLITTFLTGFMVTLGGLTAIGLCSAFDTVKKENSHNERD